MDVGVNVDGVVTMIHDYTQVGGHPLRWCQHACPCPARPCCSEAFGCSHAAHLSLPSLRRAQRTLEELFIKGPVANTRDNPEYHVVSVGLLPARVGSAGQRRPLLCLPS